MITVYRWATGYTWRATLVSIWSRRPLGSQGTYESASHALRDAWTWWPELPALIYTRRP